MGTSLTGYRAPYSGYSGLQRLNTMLDQMFGTSSSSEGGTALTSAWFPAVDVFEDKDSVKIVAEIPGVKPEDLHLSIENNVLTIRGEKRQVSEDTADRVHRYERSYGSFERSFVLPATVDADKIDATCDSGVLTITVPKAEKARPRQIEVKGGTQQGQSSQRTAGQQSAQRTSGQQSSHR
ncbi:MAG TPA: Hsp20/alpha crystallin family protein [Gemmatimonadales bacterium]|nr:Hsp20/alpha crystallin family protein [Gemmatimonadales bacterium]